MLRTDCTHYLGVVHHCDEYSTEDIECTGCLRYEPRGILGDLSPLPCDPEAVPVDATAEDERRLSQGG